MSIKKIEIMKIIKLKCLDCSGQEASEVKACTVVSCPLHQLRLGSKGVESTETEKPKRQRKPMSDSHKEALRIGRENKKGLK